MKQKTGGAAGADLSATVASITADKEAAILEIADLQKRYAKVVDVATERGKQVEDLQKRLEASMTAERAVIDASNSTFFGEKIANLFSVETEKGREFDSGRAAGTALFVATAIVATRKGIDRLSAPAAESLGLGCGGSAASASSARLYLARIKIR